MSKTTKLAHEAIELVDITTLTEAEWHEWRTKGIGGSDLAAIMGHSPWATARDVYYKKRGIVGALDKESDNSNWVAKKVGHLLEPLVAEIFASQTGFKPYEIRKMFAHPHYSFMLANVDYFVTLPDGRRAILECKTSNIHAKEKWENDAVPLNYELQCRHYMAIMDVDVAFIACLFGNNENDFVWRRIDRDMHYEADIIAEEEYFWNNYVLAGEEPPYTESGDLVLQSIRNYYGHADKDVPYMVLHPAMIETLYKYEELDTQRAEAEKAVKAIKEQRDKLQAEIVEMMGVACTASCKSGDEEFAITFNPVYLEKVDKEGLKANHPNIFAEYVSKPESHRLFKVKRVKAKVATATKRKPTTKTTTPMTTPATTAV